MNNKLSSENHWNTVHKTSSFNFSFLSQFFSGIQNYEFYNIISHFVIKDYKTAFEVGCAPGNYLINLHHKFGFKVSGIEYTQEGIEATQENFKKNQLDSTEIFFGDFFDDTFMGSKKSQYDLVYSIGFIEHFDDPKSVIERHMNLVSSLGICVLTIPNIAGINGLLTSDKIKAIHNLHIMSLDAMRRAAGDFEILYLDYSGGIFNLGLFFSENRILEMLRFIFFLFQRVLIDPIFIGLYKLGFSFHSRYSSPQILMILKQK